MQNRDPIQHFCQNVEFYSFLEKKIRIELANLKTRHSLQIYLNDLKI